MMRMQLFRSQARLPNEVFLGLVTDLFSQVFTFALITAILAGIGGYVAITTEDATMAGLVVAGVVVGIVRVVSSMRQNGRFRRDGMTLEQARRWERWFGGLTLLFALLLGLAGAQALLSDEYPSQMLMLTVLFAYGSGVASRLAMRPRIASGALIMTALPTIPALASHLTAPYVLMSFGFLSFLVGGLVIVRKNYAALIEQLLTRHEFARLARYDYLTGLPNRLMLREHLDHALAEGSRGPIALHHVDLDRFKEVNDTHGHPTGDTLLKEFGQRLQLLLREGDIAARVGGDEFVVLQVGANGVDEVERLARRIVREAHTPFAIGGQLVSVGVSVGTALAPEHGSELEELIASANSALYQVKETGRDGFAIYGPLDPEAKLAV